MGVFLLSMNAFGYRPMISILLSIFCWFGKIIHKKDHPIVDVFLS